MNVNGKSYRTIWENPGNTEAIQIIDQRRLPHEFVIENLLSIDDVIRAIKEMHVRGAPLIGAAAAYGIYLAALEFRNSSDFNNSFGLAAQNLRNARPTAVNLEWAIQRQLQAVSSCDSIDSKITKTLETARRIADEDIEQCRKIGIHGLTLIEEICKRRKGDVVNILTHCNAGWLATVDYGTATSPIYLAFEKGIPLHIWVDETRPRNQGAKLTAWELGQQGIPHTIIVDNAGGHLMQHGLVDIVIVGSDRTTCTGDAANKIGTYLKALAAFDNGIPFYVALPSSSIDWNIEDGLKDIPIEERSADEVRYMGGLCEGKNKSVLITPGNSPAANFAFDVTPARLISGLITERGICMARKEDIFRLFPEKMK